VLKLNKLGGFTLVNTAKYKRSITFVFLLILEELAGLRNRLQVGYLESGGTMQRSKIANIEFCFSIG